ncbi:MAG TPA: universal stress protein [Terriglobales bacterium]|jgi:nucleotide-binding universal stress UspA family protein|nr:universal stress protein [Terriglobales bacterium]
MPKLAPMVEVDLKRVLVATDFSAASEKALRHAIAIARSFGAKFYLAHVVSSLGFKLAGGDAAVLATEAARRDVLQLESRLVQTGALTGIEHEAVVSEGNVWEQLEQVVEREQVDLVVIGTHGRTGLRKIFMGSVAEEIFRHASCPVLTVGPCAPSEPPVRAALRHILYPTDLSQESTEAVPFAVSLAKQHGAQLTMLHVVERFAGEALADRARVVATLEGRLKELLSDEKLAVKPDFKVETGAVDETILGMAAEQSADLIVLGLRSPDTFLDHLSWLHAYKIVCGACCPVLTIRSPRRSGSITPAV